MCKARDCSKCSDKSKKRFGCVEKSREPIFFDDKQYFHCPKRVIRGNPYFYLELFRLYGMYKKGFLPVTGGLDKQPAKLLAFIYEMDVLFSKIEALKEESK